MFRYVDNTVFPQIGRLKKRAGYQVLRPLVDPGTTQIDPTQKTQITEAKVRTQQVVIEVEHLQLAQRVQYRQVARVQIQQVTGQGQTLQIGHALQLPGQVDHAIVIHFKGNQPAEMFKECIGRVPAIHVAEFQFPHMAEVGNGWQIRKVAQSKAVQAQAVQLFVVSPGNMSGVFTPATLNQPCSLISVLGVVI